jgi:hypothetical protein
MTTTKRVGLISALVTLLILFGMSTWYAERVIFFILALACMAMLGFLIVIVWKDTPAVVAPSKEEQPEPETSTEGWEPEDYQEEEVL